MELLIILAIVATLAVLLMLVPIVLIYVAWRMLTARNQVSQGSPHPAPMPWMVAPSPAARLHRRLQAAAQVARMARTRSDASGHLVGLATELEAEAAALDAHIVLSARLAPNARRHAIAALAQQVMRVEQCASRLSLLSARAGTRTRVAGEATAIDDLALQLELLEQANDELAQVEAAAGLHRPGPWGGNATSSG